MIRHRYELLQLDNGKFIAMRHCDCGTTLQSGECFTPRSAILLVDTAVNAHAVATFKQPNRRCGQTNTKAVSCRCDACNEHDRKLAEMLRCAPGMNAAPAHPERDEAISHHPAATDLGLCGCGEPAVDDLGDCGASYLVCQACKDKAER